MMTTRRFVLLALAASSLLAACDKTAGTASAPAGGFRAVDISGAEYARQFSLQDPDGKTRTLADFKGKVTVVFFGYTQCPDVCPTTMTEMLQVKQLLGADGDKLQVLFLSLDPERDTPEVLKAYMGSFDPSFLGLYAGSPDELAALAKDFKVFYKKVEGSTPGSYTMDHTASSYLYDPQGRLRLFSRYGSKPEDVAADVRLLLGGA